MLRPELADAWDVRVFVRVDAEVGLERGVARDMRHAQPDDPAADRERRLRVWRERYVAADDDYLRAVRPWRLADAVIDNNDLAAPRIRLRRSPATIRRGESPTPR